MSALLTYVLEAAVEFIIHTVIFFYFLARQPATSQFLGLALGLPAWSCPVSSKVNKESMGAEAKWSLRILWGRIG